MNNVDTTRVRGRVLATFPNRGFFWILEGGEIACPHFDAGHSTWVKGKCTLCEGKKYFAHQVQVTNSYLILDMHEGQGCEFVPCQGDRRGPNAESIVMDVDVDV